MSLFAFKRLSRLGFWAFFALISIFLSGFLSGAHADDSCLSDPVHFSHWSWVGLRLNPEFVGDWRMNVSPDRSVLTRVHAQLQLVPRAERNWTAQIAMSYPKEPPAGIPYTFQKILVQFRTANGPQTAEVNWTRGCTVPGVSIFPGQRLTATIELPDTQQATQLEELSFSIWGSQD